jgi:RNA polymerase sigma factor (sigma-70 family)
MSRGEERTRTSDQLARYLTGDRDVEQKLFDAQRDGLLKRTSGSAWMAGLSAHFTPEDLVDEVFLRVLRSGFLRSFDDARPGALADALGAILDGVAVDSYRRIQALKRGGGRAVPHYDEHRETGGTGLQPMVPSREPTPTSNARASEVLDLCQALLGPREWEVWRLIEQEGLDSTEVARRLETTDAAVRGIFRRARLRVLRALSGTPGTAAEHE